jgi:two-component system response regulator YesN
MINLVIVDDERIMRRGIEKIVRENLAEYTIAGMAASGTECLNLLETVRADLLLVDIRMPNMNGLELIKTLRESGSDVGFIIMSGYDDFFYCREAMKYNAIDYILKPLDKSELVAALRSYAQSCKRHGRGASQGEPEGNVAGAGHRDERRVIRQIKEFVQKNYAYEITLKTLSENVFLNPVYISYLFKKETGLTFTDYLTRYRVEKSKIILKDLARGVKEVAGAAGFGSARHFSATFKRLTGRTPTEYRRDLS